MRNLFPMTVKGSEKLRKELKELKDIKRPRIIKTIAIAREHGDLKENSEYQAAREEQGFCEGKIQHIESKLSNAQIIDITKIDNIGKVIFGVTVTLLNIETQKSYTYQIVGDDESDFKKNLISIGSPISRGLIGKSVGDNVKVSTPRGVVEYRILKVEHI